MGGQSGLGASTLASLSLGYSRPSPVSSLPVVPPPDSEPWPSLPVVPVLEPPGVEPPGVLSGVVGALRSTLVLPSLIALITAA